MNSRGVTWKSVVLTFVVALIFYLAAYAWLTKKQTGKGPWQVTFAADAQGVPRLTIAQPTLGISNVVVQFSGEEISTNGTGTVAFAKPRQKTPFGRVAYDDLMFQPGIVALDCFGHLIEMAPRALGLNGLAVGWTNGAVFSLTPTNKLSGDARNKLKGGYRR